MKLAIALLVTGCTLHDKTQCMTTDDCLDGAMCVGGICGMPPMVGIVGDWFGGLPDDHDLDNDGVHFDANGTWTWLHAIEHPGPEDNSRLDPDEQYCETPDSGTGSYTISADILFGAPDGGKITLLTAHELDLSDVNGTRAYFRIDPPRLAASCNP
jgi:hypothetical protein